LTYPAENHLLEDDEHAVVRLRVWTLCEAVRGVRTAGRRHTCVPHVCSVRRGRANPFCGSQDRKKGGSPSSQHQSCIGATVETATVAVTARGALTKKSAPPVPASRLRRC
jgi:hypothetical protein